MVFIQKELKMIEKKAINYYLSFFEVSKDLNEKQFYQFNMAIFEVMFFDKHIESITFEDKFLNTLWKSVKHSINASVKGYCDKKNIPYEAMFSTPCQPPCLQEKEKEKEKEKVVVFSFSLTRETSYENLSLEYREKLKEEIEKLNLSLSFIDFVDSLVAKGYKYKNFLMAYKTWCKKDFNTSKKTINNSFGGWSE